MSTFLRWSLLAGLLASTAHAQTLADTTVALPMLTVTATRTATPAAAAPARVTTVHRRDFEAAAARSVADVLEARTGVFVRRYGPAGLASMSLRGSGASQTLILLDGLRLSDPQLGQIDLSLLPSALLAGVEVMHGTGAALYGADAVGGVVQLRPLQAAARPSLRLHSTLGAFGTRTGGFAAAARRGAWAALLAAELRTTDGDFRYHDAALVPAQTVRRAEADARQAALYGSLQHDAGRHHLTVSAWHLDAERGVPTQQQAARQWDRQTRFWARERLRLGQGTLRLSAAWQRSRLRYQAATVDDTGRTEAGTLEAELRQTLGPRWAFGLGLTGSRARATHPNLAADARETHLAAFAHADGTLGRTRLFPALRVDRYHQPAGKTRAVMSPRLGLNIALAGGLHAKASAGRAFRAPTFNERFWQPGGNPDIRAEDGWMGDAGLFFARRNVSAEVTGFYHRLRDQIVWEPQARGFWAPRNVGRVRTRGVEASGRWAARWVQHGRLEAAVFYTFTDARDRTDAASASFGQPLRYVPRHQVKGALGIGWKSLQLDATLRTTGRRAVATDGSQWLPAYTLLDLHLRLQRQLGPVGVTLGGVLENALDTRYEVIQSQPMPLRHARLRLLLTFGEAN